LFQQLLHSGLHLCHNNNHTGVVKSSAPGRFRRRSCGTHKNDDAHMGNKSLGGLRAHGRETERCNRILCHWERFRTDLASVIECTYVRVFQLKMIKVELLCTSNLNFQYFDNIWYNIKQNFYMHKTNARVSLLEIINNLLYSFTCRR
jgi:hypothetical protein